jgi:phosphohistidine swiveling domain-containing protein
VDAIDLDEQFVVATPPSERFPIYTRANVIENWPGPVTTLSYTSMGGPLLDKAWKDALVRFGAFDADEFDKDNNIETIGIFYGYPFLNLSVQRVFGVRMPGANPDVMDAAFFGPAAEGVPPYQPDPRDESPEHTAKILKTIEWALSVDHLPEIDKWRDSAARWRSERPDFAQLCDRELYAYAEPFYQKLFLDLLTEHMFIIQVGSIPIGMVYAAAAKLGDPSVANRAISGFGGVDSAAPTYAMWKLSRLVAGSPTLVKEFDAGVDGALERISQLDDPDAQEFVKQFDSFLYEFGSRCSNEYEIAELSWESRPDVPMTFIDRMRLQDDSASPHASTERLKEERKQATAQLLDAVGDDAAARAQLEAGIIAAAVWLPTRDRGKTALIRVLHEARMALQELGRRMTKAGHLQRLGEVTLLKHEEFPSFLDDPAQWKDELVRRRQWVNKLADLEPPFITVGMPPPPSAWRKRTVEDLAPVTPGEVLTGIGACHGTATGTARVIFDPADGGELEPGDILVTPATDPMWTPLFVSAAAVVVDVGAPLSHAAIVSRELGIPCVVSAPHASRRIPNGATITVDGTTGTVTIRSV